VSKACGSCQCGDETVLLLPADATVKAVVAALAAGPESSGAATRASKCKALFYTSRETGTSQAKADSEHRCTSAQAQTYALLAEKD
jgi:hypothetical protein